MKEIPPVHYLDDTYQEATIKALKTRVHELEAQLSGQYTVVSAIRELETVCIKLFDREFQYELKKDIAFDEPYQCVIADCAARGKNLPEAIDRALAAYSKHHQVSHDEHLGAVEEGG